MPNLAFTLPLLCALGTVLPLSLLHHPFFSLLSPLVQFLKKKIARIDAAQEEKGLTLTAIFEEMAKAWLDANESSRPNSL
ncbi:hypothetical protein [uncultured Desulfovibrio sp.]|uniref:hypothetical protein n=1 Tax=uncultured Desulfovibrio sp. TaxID=167968 RepID=UPI0026DCE91F|nr:hypothetical protein [uncultured Desulfovibrio sp.]